MTKHLYGTQFSLIENSFLNGVLAKLCQTQTEQPMINRLVQILYHKLAEVAMVEEFAKEDFELPTRMTASHPELTLKGNRIAMDQKAVIVNLARAGTWPSHICYEYLHDALHAQNIRQDHIMAARTTNKEEQVTGSSWSGYKIGGDIKNANVIFPDPMGATGNTLVAALDYYKNHVSGSARKYIALHLIVTPEYLKKVINTHQDVKIYALRLDRGLSPRHVLEALPGKFWDLEKGLNEKDYIVPGGGGFGEVMNNSYV
jgi:uracil phosphoribosyltransferase